MGPGDYGMGIVIKAIYVMAGLSLAAIVMFFVFVVPILWAFFKSLIGMA